MADEDVANAVQPHPHLPVLATSGIESTVKVGCVDGVQCWLPWIDSRQAMAAGWLGSAGRAQVPPPRLPPLPHSSGRPRGSPLPAATLERSCGATRSA